MKHTLLLLTTSIFLINISIAQVGMMNSNAGAGREVSNYNTGNSANYNTRSEPASSPRTQSSTSQPAARGGNYNIARSSNPVNTRTNASTTNNGNTHYTTSNFTTVNTGGSNSSQPVNSTANTYAMQATMRYNNATKKFVPYFSSITTKNKINKHHKDLKDIHPPYLQKRSSYFAYNSVGNPAEPLYDDAFYSTGTLIYDNSAIDVSLDGYVVYGTDTLPGIVTITHDAVLLEQPVDSSNGYAYKFSYKDDAVKSVVVFDGLKKLTLTRPAEDNKDLLRVLHVGKLNMYDDIYSFPTVQGIDKTRIKIAYNGVLKPLTLDRKAELVKAVNAAYGLKLQPKDMSWGNLLLYINKLN